LKKRTKKLLTLKLEAAPPSEPDKQKIFVSFFQKRNAYLLPSHIRPVQAALMAGPAPGVQGLLTQTMKRANMPLWGGVTGLSWFH
jgi:hypothetical protein